MSCKKLASALAVLLVLALALVAWRAGQNVREKAGVPVSVREATGAPAPEQGAFPRTGSENALREVDVAAAIRGTVLREDPAGNPDLSYLEPENGERTINGLPVFSNHSQPSFDESNPDLFVAARDYVFVGRVERCVGTRHPDSLPYPTTDHNVTVLEVIKGNMKTGQMVFITKRGGISKDGLRAELLYRNDFLLEPEGVYVFSAIVESDRKTLGVVGPFGTVPLEDGIVAELNRIEKAAGSNKQKSISEHLKKSEVFARYVAAANNKGAEAKLPPEIRDRDRYKSVYEK
ncbi:MAG: hypothetical protein FWE94_01890 [Coriobacteriia bacterium]|nr:hypothetical protein [Coriobacteriia bacterium]